MMFGKTFPFGLINIGKVKQFSRWHGLENLIDSLTFELCFQKRLKWLLWRSGTATFSFLCCIQNGRRSSNNP